MIGGFVAFLLVPVITAIGVLLTRWVVDRPDPPDETPITPEELYRERPSFAEAECSYEFLGSLLTKVGAALDSGPSEKQIELLKKRIAILPVPGVTNAIFPIRFRGQHPDLLMEFMRFDADTVRVRFECLPDVIEMIAALPGFALPGRDAEPGS